MDADRGHAKVRRKIERHMGRERRWRGKIAFLLGECDDGARRVRYSKARNSNEEILPEPTGALLMAFRRRIERLKEE